MKPRRLRHLTEALRIAEIRNAGRSWFEDDSIIGEDQQREWFVHVMQLPATAFFCYVLGDPVVAFGYCRRREDRLWVSLAVDPSSAGRGIGSQVYAVLAAETSEPVFASIRRDNTRSRRAAELAGYKERPEIPSPATCPQNWIVFASG